MKKSLLASFFAVLTAVSAMFVIPIPMVPLTLQTLPVLLAGLLLGPRAGAMSQAVYVVLGLIGLPVLAGGVGGLHHIFAHDFGFLLGFIAAAAVSGALRGLGVKYGFRGYLAACVAGGLTVYAVGLPVLYLNLRYVAKLDVSAALVLQTGMFPFLIGDMIKSTAAAALAVKLEGRL